MMEQNQKQEELEEAKKEKKRRVAREWYVQNKDRLRKARLNQNQNQNKENTECRRKKVRIGRPRKGERKVLIFQQDTKELTLREDATSTSTSSAPPKIESGNFFVSFK